MKRINPSIWRICVTLFIAQSLLLLVAFTSLGFLVAFNEGPWSHTFLGITLHGDRGGLLPMFYATSMLIGLYLFINRANPNK